MSNLEYQSQNRNISPIKVELVTIGFLAGELSGKLDRFKYLIKGIAQRKFDFLSWREDTDRDFEKIESIYVLKNCLEQNIGNHPELRGFELPTNCPNGGIWEASIDYKSFLETFAETYQNNPRFKNRADKRIQDKRWYPELGNLAQESKEQLARVSESYKR